MSTATCWWLTVATASGDGRLAGYQLDGRRAALSACYTWPDDDALAGQIIGSGHPRIVVGLLPHANEPLGSAFAATVEGYSGPLGGLALVGPIDPPPRAHRFPLPCDPVIFAARGYLQRTQEQVEFAHCPDPKTPAQHRAAELRARIRELAADALVLLHNDPGARAPYLYANFPWLQVERRLRDDLGDYFPDWQLPGASWTHQIGERTYAFFPCERIGVVGAESAGLYIERELGIPTLTAELPMFGWGRAERVRLDFRRSLEDWIAAGGAYGGDRPGLIRHVARLLAGHDVTMVPPAVSSRVVWSVLEGMQETLATGRCLRASQAGG